MTRGLRLALVLALAGCGSSSEDGPKPDTPTKPRGAGAYDGVRKVETADLGQAANGALVAASKDAETTLAALRGESTALIVFYRGYW